MFKVNDKVVLVALPASMIHPVGRWAHMDAWRQKVGTEGVVVADIQEYPNHHGPRYMVAWNTGETTCCIPEILRKIEPPKEELTTWSEIKQTCGWRPLTIHA